MALRLIEVVIPEGHEDGVEESFAEQPVLGLWREQSRNGPTIIKVLLNAENTEPVLDLLEKRFSRLDGFHAVILPVEASIPRPKPPEAEALQEQAEKQQKKFGRVSREELYNDVADSARVSGVYIAAVLLSSIVAAIGLAKGNVAVIIGAMVIAPLLGPNVALSLGTTLGDASLVHRALKTSAVGVAAALGASLILGLFFGVDPSVPEIMSRTKVGLSDIALALASGAAGALAFTSGIPSAVIGVMVAVALLPPVVTAGLLLGSGHAGLAFGAAVLVLVNVICVNLAGVITFLSQGVYPRTWWEAHRARKTTRTAIGLWIALLGVLVLLLLWSR